MKAYLDFAATCFIRKEALEAYLEVNAQSWGNPSSIHEAGYKAARVLAKARESVLSSLKLTKTHDCLFLSGASEANNLAIKGTSLAFNSRGDKVIYGAGEHPSVIESCASLSRLGISAFPIPLRDGAPDPLEAGKMISGAILCAVMAINNETGAITDLDAFYSLRRDNPKTLLLVDATQAIGKEDFDYSKADFISFSGHKIGAPKGVGALVIRKGLRIKPLIDGGEQELGLRAGTVDVASASALAVALELSVKEQEAAKERAKSLYARFKEGLTAFTGLVKLHESTRQSPFILSFSTLRHKASVIVEGLSNMGYCVSSVSACSSKRENSSYVLKAMGREERECANPIRVSFSAFSTPEEVDGLLGALSVLFKEVRPL